MHNTFNPNYLDDVAVTQALAAAEHAPVLQAFFGAPAHAELSLLAQQALAARPDARAPRVLLLPGLLGSRLATQTAHKSELLWLDPLAVQAGRLAELALGRRRSLRAVGAMLPGYLKLKLSLQAAGFVVSFFPYDWRRSVIDLGRQLAEELLHHPDEVMLVAHSLGGLVARAALKYPSGGRVTRLVQLGTPNQGSFALLQALRGVYPTVRKLGAVDQARNAEQLTQQVFHHLPSFFEMLPHPAHTPGLNLFNISDWPRDALRPPPHRLVQARRLPRHLASADRRCDVITGVGQQTVTALQWRSGEFEFHSTPAGDGTVPAALAHWPQARHWYVPELHGHLPRNTLVCRAVVDLLQDGRCALSLEQQEAPGDAQIRGEQELRLLEGCKVRWEQLPLNERRDLLEPVISPAFAAACHLS